METYMTTTEKYAVLSDAYDSMQQRDSSLSEEELELVHSQCDMLLELFAEISDNRIESRLSSEDMAVFYDGYITSFETEQQTYEGNTYTFVKSVTVEYNDDKECVIDNNSVKCLDPIYLSLSDKNWVKICTYDNGTNYYVLHMI